MTVHHSSCIEYHVNIQINQMNIHLEIHKKTAPFRLQKIKIISIKIKTLSITLCVFSDEMNPLKIHDAA